MIIFIMLPAMVGLIGLRTPIVHLVFEHGTFTAHDTAETALAVLWLFPRVMGVRRSAHHRLSLHSLKDTTTPVISAAIAVVANILFSLVLMSRLGGGRACTCHGPGGDGQWRNPCGRAESETRRGRLVFSAPFGWFVGIGCVPIMAACWWVADAQIWAQPNDWVAKSAMLFVGIGLSVGGYLGVHAFFFGLRNSGSFGDGAQKARAFREIARSGLCRR